MNSPPLSWPRSGRATPSLRDAMTTANRQRLHLSGDEICPDKAGRRYEPNSSLHATAYGLMYDEGQIIAWRWAFNVLLVNYPFTPVPFWRSARLNDPSSRHPAPVATEVARPTHTTELGLKASQHFARTRCHGWALHLSFPHLS
jgi:hypothetical protein